MKRIIHELKNIMQTLELSVEMFARSGELSSSQERCFCDIRHGIDQSRDVLTRCFDIAVEDHPCQPPSVLSRTSNLEEIIRDSAGFVFRGESITTEFFMECPLPSVIGESCFLFRVFTNLFKSIRGVMTAGGGIVIGAESVTRAEAAAKGGSVGDYLRIVIKAHGCDDRIGECVAGAVSGLRVKRSHTGLAVMDCCSVIASYGGRMHASMADGGTLEILLRT